MANSLELSLLKSGLGYPASTILSAGKVSLAKSAVPVILAPNGTVNALGAITLDTALPLIYTSAWIRLPADAVVDGLAGLYYTVFTTTTAGRVYTNFVDAATAFTPYIPTGTLVAAVGSNAAYTQATATDVTLTNTTIPANTIGKDGSLVVSVFTSNNGTAGAKTLTGKLGASTFLTAAVTTSLALDTTKRITNRGSVAKQLVHANQIAGAVSTVAPTQLTINTADTAAITLIGQIAVATDYLVVESFSVEVQPS